MADNTKSKTNTTHNAQFNELLQRMASLKSTFIDKMEDVPNRVTALENRSPIHSATSNFSSPNSYHQRHFLKLDIPRFVGDDPHGWIFKITQFFYYMKP